MSLILLFLPASGREKQPPGDGWRARPDRLVWLTEAALWLCFRLVHLFYIRDIPRLARKDKSGVSLRTGFVAWSVQKELVRYISTTPNFLAVERVEDELRDMRQSHNIFPRIAQQ